MAINNICVLGAGYVGLSNSLFFAESGYTITVFDVDARKIELLKHCESPLSEPGFQKALEDNRRRLHFTTIINEAVNDRDLLLLALPTPTGGHVGSVDLSYMMSGARMIGDHLETDDTIIASLSTAPIGTVYTIEDVIKKSLLPRKKELQFTMARIPEFLAEGSALDDLRNPSRVVIGVDDEDSDPAKDLVLLYRGLHSRNPDRVLLMSIRAAELSKYAANTMLASRLSYINLIAILCDTLGIDVRQIQRSMGHDARIGDKFLHASNGYGGSCFPKDVREFAHFFQILGLPQTFLAEIDRTNDYVTDYFMRKIRAHFEGEVAGKTFAVWGIGFKAKSDDLRESRAIEVCKDLLQRGAKLRIYDPIPEALENAKREEFLGRFLDSVTFINAQNGEDAADLRYVTLEGADALIIGNETKEFRRFDTDRLQCLSYKVVFDGKNTCNANDLQQAGLIYKSMGHGLPEGDFKTRLIKLIRANYL